MGTSTTSLYYAEYMFIENISWRLGALSWISTYTQTAPVDKIGWKDSASFQASKNSKSRAFLS